MLSAGNDPRRRQALVVLALLALLVHTLLLSGVDLSAPRPGAAQTAAVQVRTLPAVAPPDPSPPSPPVPVAAAPRPARPPSPRTAPKAPVAAMTPTAPTAAARGRTRPTRPAPPSEPVLSPAPLETAGPVPSNEPVPEAQAASAPSASANEGAPPPLYATRLPPALTLRYELRRGRIGGSGELRWRPDAGRYELRLEGSVVGLNVLTQVSEGALEANGLAPLRFTDQRARRAAVAANFEREAGRIRFSGPSTELPWQPGVQDRLSWMVQLAAVAAAEPKLLAEGEHITLQVVGARGDGSLWSFRSLGPESLATAAGPVDTVRMLREPRSAYDTRVEVWLDPARHHLPVRATMGSNDDDRLELRLREMLP